jgi:O-antigen/teichoic acid export membrane protein
VFGGTIVGMQHFTKINMVDLTLEAGRGLATWIVIGQGGGILSLAAIQFCVSTARLVIYRSLSRRLLPELKISIYAIERRTIQTILSFSGCAILVQVSGMVILFSDSIVIGTLLPVSAVTFFMIGANLTEYGRTVLSGISYTLTPMVSAATVHHPERAAALLRRSIRLGTLTVLPILVTFLVRGGAFITLWMGPAYGAQSGSILRTLATALCFSASYQMITATMFGLNRHRRMVPVFIGEAIVNLVLSLILVRRFGILGVAIGTTVPRLIVATLIGPRLARAILGIPKRVFVREAWLRPMAAMVPFAAASFLVDLYWPAPTLLVYFAQIALCLPMAALGAWMISLDQEERDGATDWFDRSRAALAGSPT